jgi:tryptophan synthase alpha chain
MSRIDATFARLAAQGRKALIPFVTAGDPRPEEAVAIMHALVEGGADIVELGVPFSDPMADGPAIQRSSERALKHNVGLHDVIGYVAAFREKDKATPVVLMGYANPIEHMGLASFVASAKKAGVDGVLVVDYPPEEAEALTTILSSVGIAPIFLLSPTTPDERIERVAQLAKGYLYYVSLRGVTGAANIDTAEVARMIAAIKKRTPVPVGVGFGIRDGETARRVAECADAVVIGSRIVQEIEAAPPGEAAARVRALLATFRAAMDKVPA